VNGTIKTVPQLKTHFENSQMLLADDTIFENRFRAFPFDRPNSHTRARAVLYALEFQRDSKKSGLKPRDTLTVEHVLPKSPASGQWTAFSDDDRRAYTYLLGNLLLIDGPSGANEQLANKEWSDKRKAIRGFGPQTPLTQDALRRATWTASTITSRTDALANLAVKTWRT
ncbi:MAG: HNH endonuclease family protein, partial [Solirubrobacteraceae bacterium]